MRNSTFRPSSFAAADSVKHLPSTFTRTLAISCSPSNTISMWISVAHASTFRSKFRVIEPCDRIDTCRLPETPVSGFAFSASAAAVICASSACVPVAASVPM